MIFIIIIFLKKNDGEKLKSKKFMEIKRKKKNVKKKLHASNGTIIKSTKLSNLTS